MISRQHRFHGYGSLRHAYTHGQQVRSPFMALKYVLNTRRQHFRVAVVVSRKVDKSAVARNRLRRRIYEIVRAHHDRVAKPYDLIFTVFSPQLSDLSPEKLEKTVQQLLKQAGVITVSSRHHGIVEEKEN